MRIIALDISLYTLLDVVRLFNTLELDKKQRENHTEIGVFPWEVTK